MNVSILFIYLIAIIIIGLLAYLASKPPQKIYISKVVNELPPPAIFQTHWWGFGWRPYWRRYGGVPGFQKPTIPKPPKPIIIQK